MKIVSLQGWGFTGWLDSDGAPVTPATVVLISRRKIVLHYTGGSSYHKTGAAFPQQIDQWHKARGWYGVGYNYLIDQDGTVFEGRGLSKVGAHAEGHNVESWGILIGVGGGQEPSAAALSSAIKLITWLRVQRGRRIPVIGHRDVGSTLCPGEPIYSWIKAGLPAPGKESDVQLSDNITLGASTRDILGKDTVTVEDALDWTLGSVLDTNRDIATLSDRLAALSEKIDALGAGQ